MKKIDKFYPCWEEEGYKDQRPEAGNVPLNNSTNDISPYNLPFRHTRVRRTPDGSNMIPKEVPSLPFKENDDEKDAPMTQEIPETPCLD